MLYKSLKATYNFIYLKSVGSYLLQQILQHCTDLKETQNDPLFHSQMKKFPVWFRSAPQAPYERKNKNLKNTLK